MSFSPADSSIFAPLFADPIIAAIFTDKQYVRNMLAVEGALAMVQGRLGVIPADVATRISDAAAVLEVDFARLRTGVERAGVPVLALIQQLQEQLDAEAAAYVHWGATTQDVMDTALILQMRAALAHMAVNLQTLISELARLADRHRRTLMAGRTHSQQALPIPFGLKVAGWLAPFLRDRQRLNELKPRLFVIQFGGAAGTLAALGTRGAEVQVELAAALSLGVPLLPWHTQRDTLAELAGWLSLVSGSLAKMGQDIILLAQTEVAELRETDDPLRGGSSTMPQKSNPIISEPLIAGARTSAALLSAMHQALIQEHERATHGWQMEWLTLPQMFALTSGALNRALLLSRGVVVNEARMRANVAASHGLMLAEAITFALAPEYMSRPAAKRLVEEGCRRVIAEERHLVDVMQELCDAPIDWPAIRDESGYFGASNLFISRVVADARKGLD